jgi:hypothetical protein
MRMLRHQEHGTHHIICQRCAGRIPIQTFFSGQPDRLFSEKPVRLRRAADYLERRSRPRAEAINREPPTP